MNTTRASKTIRCLMNTKLYLALATTCATTLAIAATPVDLKKQSANYVKPYLSSHRTVTANQVSLKKISANTDFNHTQHVRMQQMYGTFPVFNATSVIHIPQANDKVGLYANINDKTTLNGMFYEGLEHDLAASPSYVLSDAQKAQALHQAKLAFEKKVAAVDLHYASETIQTIIYVDDHHQAHYAYWVTLYYDDGKTGAHKPSSIIDAESLHTYRTWDDIKSHQMDIGLHLAGGVGGNEKIGELIYDDQPGHLQAFNIMTMDLDEVMGRAELSYTLCLLVNDEVSVFDMSYGFNAFGVCSRKLPDDKDNLLWLSNDLEGTRWSADQINGGYSPSLDAMYNATMVNNFYQQWYGVPALVSEDGKTPMQLLMRVHYGRDFDNAFWDGKQMTFGDGSTVFYPLTSLSVVAHEISHGFTEQHGNIDINEPHMAALHEAFSDEAAVAVQYFVTGKTSFDIGRDVLKTEGALRYLDDPKKDGHSIDNLADFDNTESHAGAGVFNKAFYLLATTPGWDVHKAFNVLEKANVHYWTSSMKTLTEAACSVVQAAQDYQYNISDVQNAYAQVGIDTATC